MSKIQHKPPMLLRCSTWAILVVAFTMLYFLSGVYNSARADTANTTGSAAQSLAGAQVTGTHIGGMTFEGTAVPEHQRTTLTTVPDAIAPSIAGGNPCMISASGAGSGMGFGFSIGVGVEDPNCTVRQQVALLANMGYRDVALLHFCLHSKQIGDTVKSLGYSCADAEKSLTSEIDSIQARDPIYPANGTAVVSPFSSIVGDLVKIETAGLARDKTGETWVTAGADR